MSRPPPGQTSYRRRPAMDSDERQWQWKMTVIHCKGAAGCCCREIGACCTQFSGHPACSHPTDPLQHLKGFSQLERKHPPLLPPHRRRRLGAAAIAAVGRGAGRCFRAGAGAGLRAGAAAAGGAADGRNGGQIHLGNIAAGRWRDNPAGAGLPAWCASLDAHPFCNQRMPRAQQAQ